MKVTRKVRRRLLWGGLLLALAVGMLLAFDLRTVSTGSMEPTLWGRDAEGRAGDLLLIERASYTFGTPERFDIAVYREDADGSLRTKRIHGLSGEVVQLMGGDLYVDDRLVAKPEGVWNRCAVLLFDSRVHPYRGERGFWSSAAEAPVRDAPLVQAEEVQRWRSRPVRSDYRTVDGAWRAGTFDVRDVELELTIACPSGSARLVTTWYRGGERLCELALSRTSETRAAALELRIAEGGDLGVAESFTWNAPDELELALRRLDGVWRLVARGPLQLERALAMTEPNPGDLARSRPGTLELELELRGAGLHVSTCRVRRDLHHVDPRSADGVSVRHRVGPEHYFVLGDHAEDSRDSLFDGDVHRRELIGRVLAVLHPGSRRRWLR